MTKRLATIQDLSCIGRCSLGVAMSIVPAMGIETVVLPTAILSAHTAFDGFTFLDFTPEAEKIMQHWQELKLQFDTIYIGYLGSVQLIELTQRFLKCFHTPQTKVVLDPAFGDHGRLYTGFDMEYVQAMRALCSEADVILPNMTEACMLLDVPYAEDEATVQKLRDRSPTLISGRLENVVITSCVFPEGKMGLICAGHDCFDYAHERLSLSCHGSGDVFASVLAGLLTLGQPLERAAQLAADFTCGCIRNSMQCPDHRWYGVDYEAMIPELALMARDLRQV